jgi:hypothetical protein
MGCSASPEKGNDGDNATFWAGTGTPSWYQVQFDNVYTIGAVGVYTYYHTQTYRVELSAGNGNWVEVVPSYTTADKQPSGTADSEYKLFSIPQTNAKYIKATITWTDAPGMHIFQTGLLELEAFASG